jgi:Xaa-Pro dipeptidase
MKRRHFISSIAATTGAAAVSAALPSSLCGQAAAVPSRSAGKTTPATNIEIKTSYPEIPPFGADVYERRIERARALTRDMGGTVLVATSGATNFEYLVGRNFGRSERLIALFVPQTGEPFIIAPSFEAERVRRGAKVGRVVPWEEHESPYEIARKALGPAASSAALVVEPKTEYWTAMRIQDGVTGSRLVDGSELFERMRLVKSPEEIERMRRAIVISEDAIAATLDQLEVGMTDRDIAGIVSQEHQKRGVQGGALVQLGPQSALPHGGTIGTKLAEGMVVLIDGGCEFQGYASDITRTRWFGDAPPKKFVEMYNLVYDAQTAAMENVKPGVPCQEIDRAARAVITKGGYGEYFTHRLGHGMGMEGHEPAYMVEGNTRPLEPGFVFSVEPGIYILNEYGVRIEDDFMCTESGGALLSRRPPRL